MCEFYAPDGTRIDKKNEFVETYSKFYYLDPENKSEEFCNAKIRAIRKSSKITEDEIEKILKNGIKNETDVVHILAWKIGRIKHKDSQDQGKFVYAEDWRDAEELEAKNLNAEELVVKRYGKDFYIGKIAEFIVKHIKDLENTAKKCPQSVLNELRDLNINGLGSVYLITLLYFISKGKYPIYDRFAQMALYAICNNKKPCDIVEYKELPDKDSTAFNTIMENEMQKYIEQLESIFGDEYKKSRDIDRALWVYGHLFNKAGGTSKGCR